MPNKKCHCNNIAKYLIEDKLYCEEHHKIKYEEYGYCFEITNSPRTGLCGYYCKIDNNNNENDDNITLNESIII